jgi:hypothetical protein
MTSDSIFPEIRSLNPATLSQRRVRMFSLSSSADKVNKRQDLSSTDSAESDIKITTLNFFFAGKGGKETTTELVMYNSVGKKVDNLKGSSETKFTNDISSSDIGLAFSLNKSFGIAVMRSDYIFKANNEYTYAGETQKYEYTYSGYSDILKLGYLYTGKFNFGLYYEHTMSNTDYTLNGKITETVSTSGVIGFGVGLNESNFRCELILEKLTYDSEFEHENPPTRSSFTLEVKINGFAFGYTNRYIVNGFRNPENSMYQNLVYQNTAGEPRTENIFNFALRSARGHSFGGSFSFSQLKTDEPGIIYNDGRELSTSTKTEGLSIKYGYAY